ncbi:MAG: hypothetical protein JO235_16035 [Chroococcidiopsidaceae cyanobacterium CP_BM_RX_35]|nr:hypothetical protein [Chroococcidiopsidaceae cyanobacterium CP_BM_RX_35]
MPPINPDCLPHTFTPLPPMYLSPRAAQVRNIAVAAVNGAITLIILLIAPLGLAAVIFNTLLVTVASYATAIAADRVVQFLQGEQRAELLPKSRRSSSLRRIDSENLDRF